MHNHIHNVPSTFKLLNYYLPMCIFLIMHFFDNWTKYIIYDSIVYHHLILVNNLQSFVHRSVWGNIILTCHFDLVVNITRNSTKLISWVLNIENLFYLTCKHKWFICYLEFVYKKCETIVRINATDTVMSYQACFRSTKNESMWTPWFHSLHYRNYFRHYGAFIMCIW